MISKIITIITIIIDIILMIRWRRKRIINNDKEKERYRVTVNSWSFKLLSKSIKTLGKNDNNNNHMKLKDMGIITPITNHSPKNGYMEDADIQSSMLWIIRYLSLGLY